MSEREPWPNVAPEERFRQVGQYYENEAVKCWEITSRGHLHHGYWDETNVDDEPWKGPLRFTRMMIDWTEIGPDERFLDLGSGLGEAAIMLARAKGCRVDGVNASEKQLQGARRRAEEEGVAERVRFHLEDAVALPFADETFDGAWFFESIFHMGHAEALREAHRVLKPGALLLISDFVNLPHTSEEFIALQHEILLAHHVAAAEYPALLSAAGFELLRIDDLTQNVVVMADRKNRESFALYRDQLLEVTNDEYLPFVEQVSAMFAENAGYVVVRARARK